LDLGTASQTPVRKSERDEGGVEEGVEEGPMRDSWGAWGGKKLEIEGRVVARVGVANLWRGRANARERFDSMVRTGTSVGRAGVRDWGVLVGIIERMKKNGEGKVLRVLGKREPSFGAVVPSVGYCCENNARSGEIGQLFGLPGQVKIGLRTMVWGADCLAKPGNLEEVWGCA